MSHLSLNSRAFASKHIALKRQTQNAGLPQYLSNAVPQCAQTCVNTYLRAAWVPSICANVNNFACICSHYTASGYTFGEIGLACVENNCPNANGQSVYKICAQQNGHVQPTHTSLTLPPLPRTNAVANTGQSASEASTRASASSVHGTNATAGPEPEVPSLQPSKPLIAGIVVGVLLIFALGAGFYFYNKKKSQKAAHLDDPKNIDDDPNADPNYPEDAEAGYQGAPAMTQKKQTLPRTSVREVDPEMDSPTRGETFDEEEPRPAARGRKPVGRYGGDDEMSPAELPSYEVRNAGATRQASVASDDEQDMPTRDRGAPISPLMVSANGNYARDGGVSAINGLPSQARDEPPLESEPETASSRSERSDHPELRPEPLGGSDRPRDATTGDLRQARYDDSLQLAGPSRSGSRKREGESRQPSRSRSGSSRSGRKPQREPSDGSSRSRRDGSGSRSESKPRRKRSDGSSRDPSASRSRSRSQPEDGQNVPRSSSKDNQRVRITGVNLERSDVAPMRNEVADDE